MFQHYMSLIKIIFYQLFYYNLLFSLYFMLMSNSKIFYLSNLMILILMIFMASNYDIFNRILECLRINMDLYLFIIQDSVNDFLHYIHLKAILLTLFYHIIIKEYWFWWFPKRDFYFFYQLDIFCPFFSIPLLCIKYY